MLAAVHSGSHFLFYAKSSSGLHVHTDEEAPPLNRTRKNSNFVPLDIDFFPQKDVTHNS